MYYSMSSLPAREWKSPWKFLFDKRQNQAGNFILQSNKKIYPVLIET